MPDEFGKNAPNINQNFNEAAKQQAKKEVPFASSQGISTKTELEKRTAMETRLREKLQIENAPKLIPPDKALVQKAAEEKFKTNKLALEENNNVKEQIKRRLEEKKKQEINKEFNRSASPVKELER